MDNQDKISHEITAFQSRLNKTESAYCAILPNEYHRTEKTFPVLYLLHGLFGRFDNWLTNTDLLNYARNFPFIIICADGGDSWYADSREKKNHFYESYLLRELIPDAEQKFRIQNQRTARAVAGLSMGGYGAFKLAVKYPELFCFAGSMSGAFHAAEIFQTELSAQWSELLPSIFEIFGTVNSITRNENDLFKLFQNFPPEQVDKLPYFYFDCGKQDSFLTVNQNLAELFAQKNISYCFEEVEGNHDWDYWNRQLPNLLRAAAVRLIK